jgi:hypothetical protein
LIPGDKSRRNLTKHVNMQETESMDLKHSDTLDSVGDAYIPNSKSTDLIKPSKSGNLDNQTAPGENDFEFLLH